MQGYKFHPFAEIFPLLDDAEFDALVADIKAHGLREHIWLYEGKILDGRNRFLACKTAKVEPNFREYKGDDALAFVVSLNVQRRHLTTSQRAMAAAEIANLSKGERKSNAHKCASQDEAAQSLKVSRRSVQNAKQVIDHGSKALKDAVKSGDVPVTRAAAVVDLPKPEQLKAATQKPEPTEPNDPERPDDIDEDGALAAAEADYARRVDAVMQSDDKLVEAKAQLKQQAALIGTLEMTRDGYMRGKAAVTKLLQAEQRKVARLEKENKGLRERLGMEGKAA